jgi:uncharacterized protein YqeY
MTLEKLNQEIIKAMKAGDTLTRDVLRSAVGNIKKAAIDKKQKDNITEVLIDEVLLKEQKTLQEMIDTCPKDRTDLLNEYQTKKTVIDKYAPKILTDEREINHLIYDICKGKDFANKGEAMKFIMPQLKGKVDMKVANKVINDMIK